MIIAPGPALLRGIGAAENCPLFLADRASIGR
jgi:hypothetical protein